MGFACLRVKIRSIAVYVGRRKQKRVKLFAILIYVEQLLRIMYYKGGRIMIPKYLFQNRNEQEVDPMFTVRNMLPLLLVVLLLCGLSFGGTLWTVKSGGAGNYTTIQAALNAAAEPNDVPPVHPWPIIIEVQDNATYTGNLVFPKDVNGLTLRAGTGFSPIIAVIGTGPTPPTDTNEYYIDINSVGTTLQGFTINFTGTPYTVDNNSFMIHAKGGASTVRDCNIFGPPGTTTISRGIAGVAEINNVELSQFRQGILCDANWFNTGFNYSISNSWIHDNHGWGILFSDCNAVIDNCLIEKSGGAVGEYANVITQGTTRLLLNLLIKNSTIRSMAGTGAGRNLRLQTPGTVDINDCIIRDAKNDEILQYRGTLNLNRCILKNSGGGGGCVAVTNNEGQGTGSITNIDHCSLDGSPDSTQWAVWTLDANCHVAITNSILTGPQGLHTSAAIGETGFFTSNYNDNDCNSPISGPAAAEGVVAGPQDLRQTGGPRFNPFYIQTTDSDASIATFFALQPYSPVIGKGESGSNMGARGVVYGYEKWPADIDNVYGVDANDLEVLASDWLNDSHVIPAGPNSLLESFESKTAIPDVNCLVPGWTGWVYPTPVTDGNYILTGTSTLSLLTSGAPDGSKAMRWVYDVNMDTGFGRFTEILVILPQTIDINVFSPASNPTGQPSSPYNQLKVMLNRHAGNSPDTETFMYAKFLDKTKSTPTTGYNKEDLVAYCVGGSTDVNEGEWVPWTINLNNMFLNGSYLTQRPRLMKIGAIVFGIQDQPNGPWGLGTGTIDMDKIELVDLPGCSAPPLVGDLNNDCRVNFVDYVIFANYWLDGK